MIHFIIFALVVYVLFRAAVRSSRQRRYEEYVASRLVQRSPGQHAQIVAWHKHQHDTFAARHTANFYPAPRHSLSLTTDWRLTTEGDLSANG